MQIVFERKRQSSLKISIILIDWSCRDSFHILNYLNGQTVPRRQYEVIWIEYYNRRSPEIDKMLKMSAQNNEYPCVDKWILMEMPDNIYYHKHLLYNLGIVVSRGDIITFCDSDAVVKPTFVENIIKKFEEDSNVVLHIDEVRNINRKFYPFNNPAIEEIINNDSKNFRNGKTIGIMDQEDPLHTRNYGACMSARREDLIKIGGADEHIDYLGHVCGPYEMTFRLINAEKREIWHQEEYIYHTWHPGTDGHNNYFGPNDGRNMSTTAFDIRRSGRIMPLVENKAIKTLRLNGGSVSYEKLAAEVFSQLDTEGWSKDRVRRMRRSMLVSALRFSLRNFWAKFSVLKIILGMIVKQSRFKAKTHTENKVMPRGVSLKFYMVFVFIRRMWRNNVYAAQVCNQVIQSLVLSGVKEAAIYGRDDMADILCVIAKKSRFKAVNTTDLRGYKGKVIVASFTGIAEKAKRLKDMGIEEKNIVRLQ